MIPKSPPLTLIRDGNRFSDQIMLLKRFSSLPFLLRRRTAVADGKRPLEMAAVLIRPTEMPAEFVELPSANTRAAAASHPRRLFILMLALLKPPIVR